MSTAEIQKFYDEFSQAVMLKYFRQKSSRLEGIKQLSDRHVRDGAKILEVGCGVGILTKHLQKRASHILAVDISETGLRIAQAYANGPKVDFHLLNVLENAQPLEEYGLFDAIIVADVIEHIPQDQHEDLLGLLERFLVPTGVLLLTFPSPQHQTYLAEKEPDKLQIIDEMVSVREILAATDLVPFHLGYFDSDGRNKYVHLVLQAGVDYAPNVLGFHQRLFRRIQNVVWATRNRRLVQRIQDVLSS